MSSDYGRYSLFITTSKSWTVEVSADWIVPSVWSGYGNTNFSFEVAAQSYAGNERTGTITFITSDRAHKVTATIRQQKSEEATLPDNVDDKTIVFVLDERFYDPDYPGTIERLESNIRYDDFGTTLEKITQNGNVFKALFNGPVTKYPGIQYATAVVLPNSVEIISGSYNNGHLEYLICGSGIKAICDEAFGGLSKLQIEFDESNLIDVGNNAFRGVPLMRELHFKKAISLGERAFECCGIIGLTFEKETTIGQGCFRSNTIGSIQLNGTATIGSFAFDESKINHVVANSA